MYLARLLSGDGTLHPCHAKVAGLRRETRIRDCRGLPAPVACAPVTRRPPSTWRPCCRRAFTAQLLRSERPLPSTHSFIGCPSLSYRVDRGSARATLAASADSPAPSAERGFSYKVIGFVKSQFLPLTLIAGIVAGLILPGPGVALAELNATKYCTAGIFFISGLLLQKGEAIKAVTSWGTVLYGLCSILLITPLLAPLILKIPLNPPELVLGVAIFCLTPTTLASGVALTQIVGGNAAIAILLTIVSNMLGVFTVPFTLKYIMGEATSGTVVLSSVQLLIQLIKTVLVPALIGYIIRELIKGVDSWVKVNRKRMSVFSSMLLAVIPWMQISQAVQNDIKVGPVAIALATAIGMAVHLIYLVFNTAMVKGLRLGGDSQDLGIQRAAILVSSQKTLVISVAVITQLGGMLGTAVALALIPCVFTHLGQTVIDSILVSNWLESDKARAAQAD